MELLVRLQERQQQDADLFLHPLFLTHHQVTLAGYKSLIDLPRTMVLLQQQVQNAVAANRPLIALGSGIGECISCADERTVTEAMSEGHLIVISESSDVCMKIIPVPRTLTRAIEAPTTENVVRDSISAFVEDLDTNVGMIKKHVLSDQLRIRSYCFGKVQHRRAVLLHMEGQADPSLLDSIIRRLESNLDKEVSDLGKLSGVLGFPKSTLVTRFNTTELPQNVASGLTKGKVVLIIDRFPFALVLPSLLADMFAAENDVNNPLVFMISVRILRFIGVLSNMLMPGLYVALISVNPDALRIELAMSIAQSREGIPYPAIVETLFLLIILELLLEASIRLPKSIGATITLVGGIILGQAVVQANLVSNVLIIILSATTIASFTVVGFHNALSVRLPKYLLLVLSAMYGILGLFIGILVVCAYLASVSSFGIPYVYRWRIKEKSNG